LSPLTKRLALLGFDSYEAYLRSPGWAKRRGKAFSAAHGLCACGSLAVQVHHRTYVRLGEELPEDLHPVCRPCHEKIHALTAEGTTLVDATRTVLGDSEFARLTTLTERGKRRAKREQRKARRRAARAAAEARIAERTEAREKELAKGRAHTASLDTIARRIDGIGKTPRPVEEKKVTARQRPFGQPRKTGRRARQSPRGSGG
jgi:hypothetical protein